LYRSCNYIALFGLYGGLLVGWWFYVVGVGCLLLCGRAVCWLLFGQFIYGWWLLVTDSLMGFMGGGLLGREVVKYYNILKNIIIKLIAQILTAKGQKTINATMLQRYFLFIFSPQILINIEL